MDTQVRTPQNVFIHPQRLVVPLFQRPYVWNEDNQWEPLWKDLTRLADRLHYSPQGRHFPHFLGAVVLQQVPGQTGALQQRTIIDGQQRLTTLQLLLDALHMVFVKVQAEQAAARLEPLVVNAEPFCSGPNDRFKVWPTNRDRPAFNAVMAAPHPVDYAALGHKGERMVDAHRFFSGRAEDWLTQEGSDKVLARAAALESVVRDSLQMVVIDLAPDENAQEIFETLNARGAQLTAADLIKNFVFQRLAEQEVDVEPIYESSWKDFETAFWETEVSVGRVTYPRSSVFLQQWLVSQTGEEIVAREGFSRFKTFTTFDNTAPMIKVLEQIKQTADVYKDFVQSASASGDLSRLGLFGYRVSVLESETIKPLVLHLLDPALEPLSQQQLEKSLTCVESWLVRRALVRATTGNYGKVIAELITLLRGSERGSAGDTIESFLRSQSSSSSYWPADTEVGDAASGLQAYRRIRRARLRMVLEAVEDHLRGFRPGQNPAGEQRIVRGALQIEHVMPRKWESHWPVPEASQEALERGQVLHTIGNLTLLTGHLNSKISNGPWLGEKGKQDGLRQNSILLMSKELLEEGRTSWDTTSIRQRSRRLGTLITEIWPAPPGHTSNFARETVARTHTVTLSDLITSGYLKAPVLLVPKQASFAATEATLLPDGRIDVGGVLHDYPSAAAVAIRKRRTNGWTFFLTDTATGRSLSDARRDYLESFSEDVDEDDDSDEE